MELTIREELGILKDRIEDYLSQACILCREVYGFGGNLETDRSDLALIKKIFHKSLLKYETNCKIEPYLRGRMARNKLPRLSKMEAQVE